MFVQVTAKKVGGVFYETQCIALTSISLTGWRLFRIFTTLLCKNCRRNWLSGTRKYSHFGKRLRPQPLAAPGPVRGHRPRPTSSPVTFSGCPLGPDYHAPAWQNGGKCGSNICHWRGLWGEGLVWLIGAVVCLLAAPRVQLSVSAGSGWPHTALRYH